MATRLMSGAISKSKSNILLPIAASDVMKPVIFPPGWGSPSTNPSPTGSVTTTNTIGIVRVSRLSAQTRYAFETLVLQHMALTLGVGEGVKERECSGQSGVAYSRRGVHYTTRRC